MTNDEVCSLAISISILNVTKCALQEDVENYIRKNIDSFNPSQLIQLIVAGKYFNAHDKNKSIYFN